VLRVVNVEPPRAAVGAAPPTAPAVSAPTPVSPSMSFERCAVQDDSGVKRCAAKAAVCDILEDNMLSFALGKGVRGNV